jgi:N-acetylglucosamine-6-phosphate deacetylase
LSITSSSSTGSLVIHSARIVDRGDVVEDGWVRIEDGVVVDRGTGSGWTPADEVVDAVSVAGPDALLTPGFIDIHGHGGAGAAYDDGVDAIRTGRDLHRAHGTTRAVISLVTASIDVLARSVATIADLTSTDHDILGSHLEGPFLDPGHHGAHEPSTRSDRSSLPARPPPSATPTPTPRWRSPRSRRARRS